VTCTVNLLRDIPRQMSRKQGLIWPKMMKLPRTKLIDFQKIAKCPTYLFLQRLFLMNCSCFPKYINLEP